MFSLSCGNCGLPHLFRVKKKLSRKISRQYAADHAQFCTRIFMILTPSEVRRSVQAAKMNSNALDQSFANVANKDVAPGNPKGFRFMSSNTPITDL